LSDTGRSRSKSASSVETNPLVSSETLRNDCEYAGAAASRSAAA
jgi:hypothetical protein